MYKVGTVWPFSAPFRLRKDETVSCLSQTLRNECIKVGQVFSSRKTIFVYFLCTYFYCGIIKEIRNLVLVFLNLNFFLDSTSYTYISVLPVFYLNWKSWTFHLLCQSGTMSLFKFWYIYIDKQNFAYFLLLVLVWCQMSTVDGKYWSSGSRASSRVSLCFLLFSLDTRISRKHSLFFHPRLSSYEFWNFSSGSNSLVKLVRLNLQHKMRGFVLCTFGFVWRVCVWCMSKYLYCVLTST